MVTHNIGTGECLDKVVEWIGLGERQLMRVNVGRGEKALPSEINSRLLDQPQ